MKKLLSLLTIAGTTAIAITACGGGSGIDTEVNETTKESLKNNKLMTFGAIAEEYKDEKGTDGQAFNEFDTEFNDLEGIYGDASLINGPMSYIAGDKVKIDGETIDEDKVWSVLFNDNSSQFFYIESSWIDGDTGAVVDSKTAGKVDYTFSSSNIKAEASFNIEISSGGVVMGSVKHKIYAENNLFQIMVEAKVTGKPTEYTLSTGKIDNNGKLTLAKMEGTTAMNAEHNVAMYDMVERQFSDGTATGPIQPVWATYAGDAANKTTLQETHKGNFEGWANNTSWNNDYTTKISAIESNPGSTAVISAMAGIRDIAWYKGEIDHLLAQ